MNLHPLVQALLPELTLMVAGVLALWIGLSKRRALHELVPTIALLGLLGGILTAVRAAELPAGEVASVRSDGLTLYVRLAAYAVGVLIVLVNRHVPATTERGEFFALMLLALAGVSLTSAADDLLLLFLAVELVSVPTYVIIGLSRTHEAAYEATVKYFFLGAFASAIMLYGFSFLYGVSGTTSMAGVSDGGRSIGDVLSGSQATVGLVRLGLLLSVAGLSFKIAAAPFHFYVADVYQGAAAPVSGMLGFVPKFAGFIALIRIFDLTGWQFDSAMFWMLWAIAAVTITIGNTLALLQTNVKRVLAYSSIAHSGYMLVALLAGPGIGSTSESPLRNGVAAVLFYMAVYGVMNLGAFAALAFFRSRSTGEPVESFDDLTESARSRPWTALALAVCAIGLMGLPPTAGFIGKALLFSSALSLPDDSPYQTAMIWLVVLAVVNAAIGAVYYLKIASACVLGERRGEAPVTQCDALKAGIVLCAVLVIITFVRPRLIADPARAAAEDFRSRAAVDVHARTISTSP